MVKRPRRHDDAERRWPEYLFGGHVRTSTLVLIVAFVGLWWIYTDHQDYLKSTTKTTQVPATQVVPPGFVPDPSYTWVPRTRVQEPQTTVTPTPTPTTTPPPTDPDADDHASAALHAADDCFAPAVRAAAVNDVATARCATDHAGATARSAAAHAARLALMARPLNARGAGASSPGALTAWLANLSQTHGYTGDP